jgi:hypothetical protein
MSGPPRERSRSRVDLVATYLLAIAAVLSAWAGYQASKWHGEQAESQAAAVKTRFESERASETADSQMQIDLAIFIQWVDAFALEDDELLDFYRARFRDEFEPAFEAWIATRPLDDPSAPLSPFVMSEYQLAAKESAADLEEQANSFSAGAVEDIQRANDYVLAVVLLAATLFFCGTSMRLKTYKAQVAVLSLGMVMFAVTLGVIVTRPISL